MTEANQEEFWDKRYDDTRYIFGTKPNRFLADNAHLLRRGMKALVPGDGEGRNGVWLAGQGVNVHAVDISPVGLEKARALAAQAGVGIQFEQADLLTWTWPVAAYDLVAAIYVHFFDADRPRLHRAMYSALVPGGRLLLEAYSVAQLDMQKLHHSGGPKTADMLYTADKMRQDFSDGAIELLEERTVELDEGHRHSGLAAVVRCIVRKV